MLPESKKDRANWRSDCPEGDNNTCGTAYHLTLADAEMRQSAHSHDLEIEDISDA